MRRARTVCDPEGTPTIVKVPSAPVTAPRRVPSTTTLTSATGCWVVLSTTLPVMVPVGVCAPSGTVHSSPTTSARRKRRTTAIAEVLHGGVSGSSPSPGSRGCANSRELPESGSAEELLLWGLQCGWRQQLSRLNKSGRQRWLVDDECFGTP